MCFRETLTVLIKHCNILRGQKYKQSDSLQRLLSSFFTLRQPWYNTWQRDAGLEIASSGDDAYVNQFKLYNPFGMGRGSNNTRTNSTSRLCYPSTSGAQAKDFTRYIDLLWTKVIFGNTLLMTVAETPSSEGSYKLLVYGMSFRKDLRSFVLSYEILFVV